MLHLGRTQLEAKLRETYEAMLQHRSELHSTNNKLAREALYIAEMQVYATLLTVK